MSFPPLITAHRGASHDAPENTLAALRLGFAQGADACECDVRLTGDGRVVLLHDEDTRRVAGVRLVAAKTSLESLRRLDVGAGKGAAHAGERIPTLEEAVAVVPDGRRLIVEIKCGAEILPELGRVIADSGRPRTSFVLMSFDFEIAVEAKRRFGDIEAHWVVERERTAPAVLAARAREGGLDGLNLDRRFPIDRAFVAAVREAGLRLHVWTVDDPARAAELADAGVDSITTNRPGWLRERLTGRG